MTLPELHLHTVDELRNFRGDLFTKEYNLVLGGSPVKLFKPDNFDLIHVVNGIPRKGGVVEGIEITAEKEADYQGWNPLVSLTEHYSQIHYVIRIHKNTQRPLIINNYYTESGSFVPSSLKIVVENSVTAHVLELNHSSQEMLAVNNRNISVKDGFLNYARLDYTAGGTSLVYNYRGSVEKGAFNSVCLSDSGEYSLNNWEIRLMKEGAESHISGVVSLKGEMEHGNICKIVHCEKQTVSSQEFRHILDGRSYAMYDGDSSIINAARDASSSQASRTIMLNKGARILNKPRLNIFTSEVKAVHGVTVGKLQPEDVFYMKQRGIPEDVVKKLLTEGFMNDLFDRIPSMPLREMFYEKR